MTELVFFPPRENNFPILGSHVHLHQGSLEKTIRKCLVWNIGGIQIFLSAPTSWVNPYFTMKDIKRARTLLFQTDFFMVIHATYLYNLHGTKNISDPKYEINFGRTIQNLAIEMDIGAALGIGVVVHINSADPPLDECVQRISECINETLTKTTRFTHQISDLLGVSILEIKKSRKIVLENSAGEGSKKGKNLNELKLILDSVREDLQSQVYVCIDTCHLFAAGDYDISRSEEIERFFSDFDRIIGSDRLHVIHLNDSLTPFGSHIDRHINICCGHIWSKVIIEGKIPTQENDNVDKSIRGKKCKLCTEKKKYGRTCNQCKKWVCSDCGLSKVHYPCPQVRNSYMFVNDFDHFKALQTMVSICTHRKIPMILEVPGSNANDIEYVYSINNIVSMMSLL